MSVPGALIRLGLSRQSSCLKVCRVQSSLGRLLSVKGAHLAPAGARHSTFSGTPDAWHQNVPDTTHPSVARLRSP